MGVKVKTWDRLQRQNRVNKIWLLLLREGEELSMKPRFQVCIMESMIMPFTKASIEEDWGELLNLVMDREACHAVLHGFSKSRTRLSDWTELNCRFCSKSFKLGFSSKWTENFQVYELGLEKADDPEIKLPTFVASWRKQGNSIKTSNSGSLTTQAFDSVDHNKLWKTPKHMGIYTFYGWGKCQSKEPRKLLPK